MSRELPPIAPEIDTLLDAERRYEEEPAARRARVLERLEATAAALGAPAVPASPIARFVRTKAAIALGAALAGATFGGVAGYRLGQRAAPRAAAPTALVTAAAVAAPPSPPVTAAPAPTLPPEQPPAPSSAARAVAPPRSAPPARDSARGEDDLAMELSLVQMARTALARGNYQAAIDAAEQHARAFPKGHLAEEREGLVIQALVGAGREGEARARAEKFRAKYPQSPLLPSIDAALSPSP